ncbi:hypothetical protein C8R44DRAFT_871404 [Mycena epipterygia]|nr:hypothetical protein C8R44DRAFT_871404 [Mycena epipterygia]
MTPHSVLFNTIVDLDAASRANSPVLSSQAPRSYMSSSMSNPYWGTDNGLPSTATGHTIPRDYSYSQPRGEMASSVNNTLPNSTRSSGDYSRQSDSSNPTIDFTGLIPMYDERGSPDMDSRGQLMDLSYDNNDWPTSNMGQYATFQRNKSGLWPPLSSGHMPSQHWDSSLGPGGSMTQHFHEYAYSPPSPYSSGASSSSSSPSYFLPTPSTSNLPSARRTSRRGNTVDDGTPKKSCFHCHVTSTPLWRREPVTQRPLCNACGLYLQQRNKLRPQELIDADIDDDDTPEIPDSEYTGPKCSHCLTRQTSVWRRSKTGAQVCNACGVYARLRGKERPLSLRRNKIKPRTKHSR